jgi:protein required for attachment to host cells
MKTLYVLVADKAWAKLYKSSCPPEQLTLIYHQRNLPSQAFEKHDTHNSAEQDENNALLAEEEDFARSLCKVLKVDCQAGKFDGLVVISSGEFLAMIYEHLGKECRERLVGGIVQVPGLLSEQNLMANVRSLVEKQLKSRASALSSGS